VEAARQAVGEGADYLGSGPAFATPVKPEKAVIGPRGIAAIAATVEVPVFAIGGIDDANIAELTEAGLHRACVIRAIGEAVDPESVTRRLRAMLDR
jgi:thiamine-phosphate pyrophosphorylase